MGDMIGTVSSLLAGLVLLTLGAELLIQGASALAARLGISPVLVGLTVVALGTSAPELTVSTLAALQGQPDLALGNVLGSNTYNVLLILGVAALLTPLSVSLSLLRIDIPVMVGTSALLWLQASDGVVSPRDGAVLLVILLAYLARILHAGMGDQAAEGAGSPATTSGGSATRILTGLVLLVAGTRLFVDGAVALARGLGVSELVIGLTIAPEGVRAASAAIAFDVPVMVVVAVACIPAAMSGTCIDRREGLLFLVAYASYVACLVYRARGAAALPGPGWVAAFLLLPLALMTWTRRRRGVDS